jgi:hypothetical protein
MDTTNEPVAWMSVELDGRTVFATYEFETAIPLYTHPSEHDLGIAEAIGFDKGYKAATAKTLTDEEIHEVFYNLEVGHTSTDFARAILRKAQGD